MDRVLEEDGIIVGTSKGQEWLLPWWWMHLRAHNDYPVTFIDFGDLSDDALSWCRSRGTVIKLDLIDNFIVKKDDIDPQKARLWESMIPHIWQFRFTYYKKPFALLKSPYSRTVWIDLDCQIRGSLKPLFPLCANEGGIALIPEHEGQQQASQHRGFLEPGELMYNAGVIVFKRGSKIVEEWAKQSRDKNHLFPSDQQLLANILHTLKLSFNNLSPLYNWTVDQGLNPNAAIIHWFTAEGKEILKKQIDFLNSYYSYNISLTDDVGKEAMTTMMRF
jgi:hypothetical protein